MKNLTDKLLHSVLSISLFFSFCCLFAASANSAFAAQNVIHPGRGVGNVQLGQNLQQVYAILGPASKTIASPNDPNAKLYYFARQGLAVFVGSNGAVIGITVTGSGWCTPEGISLGSPTNAVLSSYGRGLQRGQGNVNYAQRGIAFSMRQGKVVSIYVFKPEEAKALLGDRIIVPGKRVGQIMLGMSINIVNDKWGNADKVIPLGGNSGNLHRYKEEAVGLVVSGNIIQGVVLDTGDFITAKGVKVGSSKNEVIRAFGNGFSADKNNIVYERLGIGFLITGGRVQQITVLRPNN